MHKQKVKYEDLRIAKEFFAIGGYLGKFDLRSGYHHLSIQETDRQYLGFAWEFNGKIRYFVFNVLVFGLSTAPFILTKLLRPLVRHWRGGGLQTVVFLDDGIFHGSTIEQYKTTAEKIKSDLDQVGFSSMKKNQNGVLNIS